MTIKTRILGVGSSPRKNGNSDLMLQEVLKGAKEQGLETEAVYLRDYQFYNFTTDHPRAFSSRLAGQGRKAVVAAVAEQLEEKDMGFTIDGMVLPLEALGYELLDRVSALGHFHLGKVAKDPQALQACFQAGQKLGQVLKDQDSPEFHY